MLFLIFFKKVRETNMMCEVFFNLRNLSCIHLHLLVVNLLLLEGLAMALAALASVHAHSSRNALL
jgi:hypothetical protein